jgi:general secretion pathway protein A
MYEQFFGLRERPFDLTPNPRFLVLTPQHREALSNLHYGIMGRKGITLLIGEAGTGKTTLVRAAVDAHRQQQALCVYVNNPTLSRQEFIEFLSHGFGLSAAAHGSKAVFLRELEQRLLLRSTSPAPTLLVIDEAQSLSHELLEEVRLLANIETADEKLLPVVLAGQPELAGRLNDPSLRQLKQRVALRCELRPLTLLETTAYIASRARCAGADHPLFTREAVGLIHHYSGGIPRTISVICDNALVNAFAVGQQPVGREIVFDVCRDFDLAALGPAHAAVAPPHTAEQPPPGYEAVLRIREQAVSGVTPADQADSGAPDAAPRRRRLSFF